MGAQSLVSLGPLSYQFDGWKRVPDKLGSGHLLANVGQMKICIEEQD